MDEHPWSRYSKDPIPQGLAYPVGRDVVQRELELSGASVDSLSFSRPDKHSAGTVLDIHWSGDVPRRLADVIPAEGFLLMVLQAVPSTERPVIGAQLRDRWLPEAATWIARIPDQGVRGERVNTDGCSDGDPKGWL